MTAPRRDRAIARYYAYVLLSRLGFQRGIFLVFLADRGLSSAQIGWLEAALFISIVLAEVPAGIACDRFGHRTAVGIGLTLLAANGLGLALGEALAIEGYLLLFLVEGIGFAFISGADSALLYELLAERGRAGELVAVAGRARALGAVAMAAAIAAGGALERVSWAAVYGAYVVAMLLAVVAVAGLRPRAGSGAPAVGGAGSSPERSPGVTATLLAYLLHHPDGRLLLRLSLAIGLLEAVLVPLFLYSPVLLQAHGVGVGGVATVNAIVELSSIPALLALPALCARAPAARLLRASFAIAAALLVAQLAPSAAVAAIAYIAVFALPLLTTILAEDLVQRRVSSRIRASMLSTMSFVASALVGVGYVAYGLLLERVAPGVVVALGAVPALAGLLVLRGALSRLEAPPSCS